MNKFIRKIFEHKNYFICFLSILLLITPVFSAADKTSEEYLKSKKHFAIMNPVAEKIAQKIIKKSLLKEAKGRYKVKFDGYTISSMKKGIFKNIEITGKNITVEDIEIPYIKMKSVSDYNWIDYNQKPIVIKSDMVYDYEMHLSDKSINDALKTKEYQKKLQKVNNLAYPLFIITDVQVKIKEERMHIAMEYNFPIKASSKNRTFVVSSGVKLINQGINLNDVQFSKTYGNLPLNKVINLINLVDPLSFTLDLMENKKCNGRIENVKIEDDFVKINGKIYVKADGSNS